MESLDFIPRMPCVKLLFLAFLGEQGLPPASPFSQVHICLDRLVWCLHRVVLAFTGVGGVRCFVCLMVAMGFEARFVSSVGALHVPLL